MILSSEFPALNGATALPALGSSKRSNMSKPKIRIKASHRGLLHKDTSTPMGHRISAGSLEKALRSAHPAVRKRANFARNAKSWNKG
jgi:hypothetical protein